MAKTQSSNYTATNTDFQIPGADSDTFDRNDITKLGQALEEHTHASTRGLQIPTGGIADDAVTAAKIADGAIDAAAKLGSDVVTTAKILDANVTAAKLASDAVTTAKILDANVTAAKLASDAVTTAKILDANVTTAKINDGAVTAAKLSGSTVLVTNRQGGDATDWGNAGTDNYQPASAVMQCGEISATIGDGDLSTAVTVTYPAAFGGTPIILTGVQHLGTLNNASETAQVEAKIASGTKTTQVTFWITRFNPASTSGTQLVYVDWLAIGPPA